MPMTTWRRHLFAGVGGLAVLIPLALERSASPARAEEATPKVALGVASGEARRPFAPRGHVGRRADVAPSGTGGWWLGTAGIALALALCGGASVASRRYRPQAGAGPLRVVGRTSLSPRHTVYLLQAGDRVLIVGTGPQGAPSLLGELDDPVDSARPAARRPPAGPPVAGPLAGVFDRRVGDEQ